MITKNYRAVISSDWSECLSPSGPFDAFIYNYPHLEGELTAAFRAYTGNRISLGEANRKVQKILPGPLSLEQMDAYLDAAFSTYKGVPDFIEWCLSHEMLFMINTTGLTGYFQRVLAKGLLPPIAALSSNAMIQYHVSRTDPGVMLNLTEIEDKAKNTAKVLRLLKKPPRYCILMGDSGGDGPHFEWGAAHGARLIGSMPKDSLLHYCRKRGIDIDVIFGSADSQARTADPGPGHPHDFMALTTAIEALITDGSKTIQLKSSSAVQ
jgi:hypothetical protein